MLLFFYDILWYVAQNCSRWTFIFPGDCVGVIMCGVMCGCDCWWVTVCGCGRWGVMCCHFHIHFRKYYIICGLNYFIFTKIWNSAQTWQMCLISDNVLNLKGSLQLCRYLPLLRCIFGNGICPFQVLPWTLCLVFYDELISKCTSHNYFLHYLLHCIHCLHINDMCEHISLNCSIE